MLSKLNEKIKKIEEQIAQLFIVFIVLLVFTAALARWFKIPIAWTIDMSQLLFGWAVFLGADLAMDEDRHVGMEILSSKLPLKYQKSLTLFWNVILIIFLVVCVYYGTQLCLNNSTRKFNTMRISYSYLTAAVPVGSLLMIRTLVDKSIILIKELKTGDFFIKRGEEKCY